MIKLRANYSRGSILYDLRCTFYSSKHLLKKNKEKEKIESISFYCYHLNLRYQLTPYTLTTIPLCLRYKIVPSRGIFNAALKILDTNLLHNNWPQEVCEQSTMITSNGKDYLESAKFLIKRLQEITN